jgi:hypothetical protein
MALFKATQPGAGKPKMEPPCTPPVQKRPLILTESEEQELVKAPKRGRHVLRPSSDEDEAAGSPLSKRGLAAVLEEEHRASKKQQILVQVQQALETMQGIVVGGSHPKELVAQAMVVKAGLGELQELLGGRELA